MFPWHIERCALDHSSSYDSLELNVMISDMAVWVFGDLLLQWDIHNISKQNSKLSHDAEIVEFIDLVSLLVKSIGFTSVWKVMVQLQLQWFSYKFKRIHLRGLICLICAPRPCVTHLLMLVPQTLNWNNRTIAQFLQSDHLS